MMFQDLSGWPSVPASFDPTYETDQMVRGLPLSSSCIVADLPLIRYIYPAFKGIPYCAP